MILTSADSQASSVAQMVLLDPKSKNVTNETSMQEGLDIVGPTGTRSFVHSLRHFMRREKFPIHVHEGLVFHVSGNVQKRIKKRKHDDEGNDSFRFSIHSIPFRERHSVYDRCVEREVVSFIFKTPPMPGKFLPAKAKELGVPTGPLYGKLKSGKSVTFLDSAGHEKTVDSNQVVSEGSPSVAVFVLYYSSIEVGEDILTSTKLRETLQSNEHCVEVVLHLCTKDSFQALSSRFWTHDPIFCSSIDHIFVPINDCETGSPFRSAAIGARARSLLCGDIYRIPLRLASSAQPTKNDCTIVYREATPMLEYVLIPRLRKGYRSETIVGRELEEIEARELVQQSGAMELCAKLLPESCNDITKTNGELLFTGTGSAIPCKYRNVTGMMYKGPDGRSMLLDVGEGTIGQLLRLQSSPDYKRELLESIKAVWISHPHADHHLGLLHLLHERRSSEPVLLLASDPLFRFLEEYCAIVPSVSGSYIPVNSWSLIHSENVLANRLCEVLGISGCKTVPVTHCPHSFAIILDGTDFGKIVYSGDCRPSHQLADAGIDADLLIHEATFEDGMEEEACLKRHSTVSEALGVADRMKAKGIVLTHFSQRYPKIPPIPQGEKVWDFPIVFAFDYMRLSPETIKTAARVTPALRLLFPADGTGESNSEVDEEMMNAQEIMSTPGLFAHSEVL